MQALIYVPETGAMWCGGYPVESLNSVANTSGSSPLFSYKGIEIYLKTHAVVKTEGLWSVIFHLETVRHPNIIGHEEALIRCLRFHRWALIEPD